VDPRNESEVASLAAFLMDNPQEVEERRENARQLVRENLTWDRTIEPLARWCAKPQRREKRGSVEVATERIVALRRRLEESEAALRELEGRRLVKVSNLLRRFRSSRTGKK
jgi:predicted RNase H-like nuclease (RuvC/YqgF family)